MNVSGSPNRFAYLIDPKLVIFQASILGPFLTKKKITIRDLFCRESRFFLVTIHDEKITNHDMIFFSFSL